MGAWHDGFQWFVPQQVGGQVEPCDVSLIDPGNSEIETAFSHSLCLGMRWQDPLVNTDSWIGYGYCLRREPADITKAQRQFPATLPGPIEGARRGVQHFSSIVQKLGAGGCQLDVPAVADEELGSELSFEIADLVRERRSGDVESLCCTTEMQFFGYGNEVGELPEFHALDPSARAIIETRSS